MGYFCSQYGARLISGEELDSVKNNSDNVINSVHVFGVQKEQSSSIATQYAEVDLVVAKGNVANLPKTDRAIEIAGLKYEAGRPQPVARPAQSPASNASTSSRLAAAKPAAGAQRAATVPGTKDGKISVNASNFFKQHEKIKAVNKPAAVATTKECETLMAPAEKGTLH